MGSLFKSKTKAVQQPFETNPWEAQQPYLKEGFSSASDAFSTGMNTLGGVTDFTADMTDGQRQDLTDMRNLGRGTFGNVASGGVSAGMSTLPNFAASGDNYSNLYRMASEDPTQGILTNARAYADDPFLQGQIDSALGDVRKAFDRNVGDINAGAVGTGNINSTRAGALEAIALDDAMDRGASIASGMRGQAYQAGLDRAMTTQQNQFDNQLTATGALEANGLRGFDLASSGAALGMDGLRSAYDAGSIFQGQDQAEIEGMLTKAGMPLDLVKSYMAAVGGNYGNSGYTTAIQETPSPFQTLVGGLATFAGAGGRLSRAPRI